MMVLLIRRQPWAMNKPHVKHMAASFEHAVEEVMEPVEPWVHAAAAVEM